MIQFGTFQNKNKMIQIKIQRMTIVTGQPYRIFICCKTINLNEDRLNKINY